MGNQRYTWFIYAIIGVYFCIPVINSFIKEYGIKGIKYYLILWAFAMSLNTFNLYPFYKLELVCFSGYLGYFILGYYLANYAFKFNSKTLIKIGIFSFIIGTVILMFIDNFHNNRLCRNPHYY